MLVRIITYWKYLSLLQDKLRIFFICIVLAIRNTSVFQLLLFNVTTTKNTKNFKLVNFKIQFKITNIVIGRCALSTNLKRTKDGESSTEIPNPIIDRDLATSVDNKTVPSYLKLCSIMKRMGRMVYDRRRRIFIGSAPI